MASQPDPLPEAKPKVVTAGLAVIGNEILSGRTQDANIAFLGRSLNEIGIQLREVRIVPDITEEIVAAVNALRHRYDYVFTTGGIGPTHDDITPESIAAAFGVEARYHPEAYARLERWYAETGREFTEGRKRMALMPAGAELVDNEATVAPGFRMGNVFVFAGVPAIMQSMFKAARRQLVGGSRILFRSIATDLPEGRLADGFRRIQERHPTLDLGSYPTFDSVAGNRVALVLRGPDRAEIDAAAVEVLAMIDGLGGRLLEDASG